MSIAAGCLGSRAARRASSILASLHILVALTIVLGPAAPPGTASAAEVAAAAPDALKAERGASTVTVSSRTGPVLEYAFAGVPFKPYARAFHTPAGINVLRDAPFDHLHHHALMYAVAVEGTTFWGETEGAGRQAHKDTVTLEAGKADGISTEILGEKLDWIVPGEKGLVAQEQRSIRVFDPAALGASLITWTSELRPAAGKESVQLGGDHYYGLGARFLVSMDKDGKFLYTEGVPGEIVRGDERLTPGRWCAYVAKADGKPVTVAMFDHPSNPRKALWFTMQTPFAYLSATVNLWKEPMALEAGKSARFTYGVALWDGEVDAARIEALCRKWVELEKAAEASGPAHKAR